MLDMKNILTAILTSVVQVFDIIWKRNTPLVIENSVHFRLDSNLG